MLPEQSHRGRKSEPLPGQRLRPTPSELRAIFDEQDAFSEMSAESWKALRALAEEIKGDPVHYGSFVRRPDPADFYPDLLSSPHGVFSWI